jgi:protein-S-isoprenylcysteine O-methyltransferase Ste14
MRATDFEFRNRFWVIAALFAVTFGAYTFDHRNAAQTLARALGHDTRLGVQIVFGMGALLALTAAWIRTWANAYLHTTVVKAPVLRTERLVADGPYRYLRNPLYFGTVLLGVSFGLIASPTGFVIIVVGLTLFTLRLIGREEAELVAGQGAAYEAYRRAVPALLPALSPRVQSSGTVPQWRQAFVGEGMMWAFGIGLALFAITLNQWVLYAFVAVGFISYLPGGKAGRTGDRPTNPS